MIRIAQPEDAAALEAFLRPHAATSMFLRGNLEAHGIGSSVHANATTYYLRERAGRISGVAACTNGGFAMCQAPGQGPGFWSACGAAMRGRRLIGMTGVPGQIEAFRTALGLRDADFRLRDREPLYALKLENLALAPAGALSLRAPRADEVGWLAGWFDGYHRDTGMGTLDGVDGPRAARRFVEQSDARVMEASGTVCAMSTLNARAAEMVQVGGVYVPPEHRGLGYGRWIVALHLAELRAEGVSQAILFAASDVAARAYEAIGFRRIGSYEIALLKAPICIGAVE